jgi:Protein of unknown function (DUF3574)
MDANFATLRNAICDVKPEAWNAMLRVIACGALTIASGCSQVPGPLPCARLGGTPMLEYHLFFGRASVTDPAWAEFSAHVITPQLPDGFTVLDANGQWMNPMTHRIVGERTTILVVALPDSAANDAAITAVKDTYHAQFHQQSVGTTVQAVCAAF